MSRKTKTLNTSETARSKPASTTPMMAQYLETKARYADYLLMYRLGDFYELFFDDAKVASEALGLALTTHHTMHMGAPVPMCGIPYHAFDLYIPRLIRDGHKVAVCDQIETPEEARRRGGAGTVIRREVSRIITAGTLTEDSLLEGHLGNYLCAVWLSGGLEPEVAAALLDISTGSFRVASWGENADSELAAFLAVKAPSEIIVPDKMAGRKKFEWLAAEYKSRLVFKPESFFDADSAKSRLAGLFGPAVPAAFDGAETAAIGAALSYIALTQIGSFPKLSPPEKGRSSEYMQIDAFSVRNLELFEPAGGGGTSLFGILDRTRTPMGKRLLRDWLGAPLTDPGAINARLDMVQSFFDRPAFLDGARELLGQASDLERIMGRMSLSRAGPRDLLNTGKTMALAPRLKALLVESGLAYMADGLCDLRELYGRIESAIIYDPPILASSGNFVREGFHPALDEYRSLAGNIRRVVTELQAKYALDTGIASLKVRYNTLAGYFIEVPAAKATPLMDPASGFRHRQTLVNAVRFTTGELEETESKALVADEKYAALELEIFGELSASVLAASGEIGKLAGALARLDAFSALALVALENSYSRPAVDGSLAFDINEGRHPMVECALKKSGGSFIPNDSRFEDDGDSSRLWLLTGPNMAGKSTFLRQNAVMVVMAQAGSFVPAAAAHIGVVDKLFSRVGASDNLAQGLSTFMVEMSETAAILQQADERSFVILDEIGRGTATFDGLSIAWAVLEYLNNISRCRGLFATHYHELGAVVPKLKGVSARTMEVKEYAGDIIFMHRVVDGLADHSYGIHVARLAGVPASVADRAASILESLESDENIGKVRNNIRKLAEADLFSYRTAPAPSMGERLEKLEILAAKLKGIEPDALSPKSALELLYGIRELANGI